MLTTILTTLNIILILVIIPVVASVLAGFWVIRLYEKLFNLIENKLKEV